MPTWLVVVLILVGVLALAGLRAWTWIRKERLLREVGLLTSESDENPAADPPDD